MQQSALDDYAPCATSKGVHHLHQRPSTALSKHFITCEVNAIVLRSLSAFVLGFLGTSIIQDVFPDCWIF